MERRAPPSGLLTHDLSRIGQTRWACFRVRQASFVSLFVTFHFLFLLLSNGSVGRLWLNFIAVQKRSPCRVGTVLAIFQFFEGGAFRLRHCTMIIEKLRLLPLPRRGKPRLHDKVSRWPPVFTGLLLRCRVRHRFRATFSRQPRQVRKEATVTGSFVCSGAPVPGFSFVCCARLEWSYGRLARLFLGWPGGDARLSTSRVSSRFLRHD